MKTYKRAIKVKLYLTSKKQRKVKSIIEAYRKAVNNYLIILHNQGGRLDKETLAKVQSKLSERYKSNALKQALGIHKSCMKTKNKIPKFNGFPILDAKFVNIENGKNSFDLWIKLSTLSKGKRIYLPSKKHLRLNYWLSKGELIQGCELHENKLILWVKVEKENYKNGQSLGIDLGINKLITTNQKQYLGQNWKLIVNKILRKTKNSKAYKRALKERDNYVNRIINLLPWNSLGILCYENLKNIKKESRGRRKYKRFRVKQQYWIVGKVISRILVKCEENRVRPIYVNPKNTSRNCPVCSNVDEANRVDEYFNCLTCNYKEDADLVGAINIHNKGLNWLRSLESLNLKSNI